MSLKFTYYQCSNCGNCYTSKQHLEQHKANCDHYHCMDCNKDFSCKRNLLRHNRTKHAKGGEVFRCESCGYSCKRSDHLKQHQRLCKGLPAKPENSSRKTEVEGTCGHDNSTRKRKSSTEADSTPSQKKHRKTEPGYRCCTCNIHFQDKSQLYRHQHLEHQSGQGGELQQPPWTSQDSRAPWEDEQGNVDEGLQETYQMHENNILAPHSIGEVTSEYNFPVDNDLTLDQLTEQLDYIYNQQETSFRINLSVGLILQNSETGRYRFFRTHQNGSVFQRPLGISNREALEHVRAHMETLNLPDYLLRQRDDTKSVPVLLVNVVWFMTKTGYPLGAPTDLPDYIKYNKAIVNMDRHPRDRTALYKDNLCAFRCLAYHREKSTQSAEKLFLIWKKYTGKRGKKWTSKTFPGITLDELPDFEECFKINVNVFQMSEEKAVTLLYRSLCLYDKKKTLNLNAFELHLSYIKDLKMYSRKYECETCKMLFKTVRDCVRHYKTCKDTTRYTYPGGFHQSRVDVADKLARIGVHVEEELFFPYFAVFDFEAILEKSEETTTDRLKWTQKHNPISVSVCSNVPGYTAAHCVVEPDLEQLLQDMLNRLNDIQQKSYLLALVKWSYIWEQIAAIKKTWGIQDEDEEELEEEDNEGTGSHERARKLMKKPVLEAEKTFQEYCQQLPVLSFNGAKYDLNLIKAKMAKVFHFAEKSKFVVKKANAYASLTTDRFKFLDVTQYLAPGNSYSSFLKSFQVSEDKGYFPYEWMDSLEKLNQPSLPSYVNFYSTLKKANVLELEYQAWTKDKKGPAPKTGPELYQELQQIWQREGMTTFRDYLIYYNNLDVGPFVEAVEKMLDFYKSKRIDLFKTSISVPGVARQLLYRTSEQFGSHFALIDKFNTDLYKMLKANIAGGPSIVFHRNHVKGETKIRGDGSLCQAVVGYDANALYLWALGQEMPTEAFVRRFECNGFKPEKRDRFMAAYDWLEWLAQKQSIKIMHRLNSYKEVRKGPYQVDGYCAENNTIYQYDGCYFHGHLCNVTRKASQKWHDNRQADVDRTASRDEYHRDLGYNVVVMRECEFMKLRKEEHELTHFITQRQPAFCKKFRGPVSSDTILKSVRDGDLFGCIEVDIEVPDVWSDVVPNGTELGPYDYFKEMSPLFCNATVPFEKIGEHMQRYVKEAGLSEKPRRLLVGGMKAKKILLASPLLQWYLNHGMRVTRVYQCVEYTPAKCFEAFTKEVTECRRMGDKDPDCEVLASTMKLIGNSAYGSLLMDKEKHQNIKYVSGKVNACQLANKKQFRRATELGDNIFEMEMAKAENKLDMPVQVGYFILQLAKLRMLQFYYDFLDVYVSRKDYEMNQMDTDSFYMAISGPDLESVIKPEYREKFCKEVHSQCHLEEINANTHWFPRECCKKHKNLDKRTPGLFKLEYAGTCIVALCSKTYAVKCDNTNTAKFSSKGCNKSHIGDAYSLMDGVLKTKQDHNVVNRGFRARNNGIFTYTQNKKGLCNFYCKRKILEDGVSTVPLDMVLTPCEEKKEEVVL